MSFSRDAVENAEAAQGDGQLCLRVYIHIFSGVFSGVLLVVSSRLRDLLLRSVRSVIFRSTERSVSRARP